MEAFRPEFEGTYSAESLRPDFVAALAERVRKGIFRLASERRNRYAVVSESDRELRFRSEGFLTAINTGWNDVRVEIGPAAMAAGSPIEVRYHVTYFAWAAYCVGLCGFIGIALIAVWLLFEPKFSALSGAGKPIFWVMVIFWGFVWPWILVALHKRPAARALEQLFAEVNEAKP